MSCRRASVTAAVTVGASLLCALAWGFQTVPGERAVAKSRGGKAGTRVLAKGPSGTTYVLPVVGGPDDPTSAGGELAFCRELMGGPPHDCEGRPLQPQFWAPRGFGWKFRRPPSGGFSRIVITLKSDRFRVRMDGLPTQVDALNLDADVAAVRAELRVGGLRYCASFPRSSWRKVEGTPGGSRVWIARDGIAPPDCLTGSASGAFLDATHGAIG